LWQGTVGDLVRDPHKVAEDLVRAARSRLSSNPEEEKSWREGLPLIAKALEGQGLEELGAALELMIPVSLYRVDLVLAGKGRTTGKKAILVVELKLWEKPQEDLHPSLQARGYADYLRELHSFGQEGVVYACAYLPKMDPSLGTSLKTTAPEDAPIFLKGEEKAFARHIRCLLQPPGEEALESALNGTFSPSRSVVDEVGQILHGKEWALLGEQRKALEEIWRAVEERKNLVAIVRGKPGTGKTVVAMHLVARALKHGKRAAYSIGGKAMNQVLRAKLGEKAKYLIKYNLYFHDPKNRKPPLDLLVVDEAHRLRERTGGYGSPTNIKRPEVEALIESGHVAVFFLDDHQSVRSDEVGSTRLIQEAAQRMGRPCLVFDLEAQFRCGGDNQYLEWVDWLLGYGPKPSAPPSRVRIRLVGSPKELEAGMRKALKEGKTARIVAGFCWPWSDPLPDGRLVPDVKIGGWKKPWNRKPKGDRIPPSKHPYTLWATRPEGAEEVGCIYSAQGFEFDWVGVIWGEDLVYRNGEWKAQPEKSFDPDVKRSKGNLPELTKRLRNVYRVLLTRAREEVAILCLDDKTRAHLEQFFFANPRPLRLDDLLEGITEANRHEEVDWGPATGREA